MPTLDTNYWSWSFALSPLLGSSPSRRPPHDQKSATRLKRLLPSSKSFPSYYCKRPPHNAVCVGFQPADQRSDHLFHLFVMKNKMNTILVMCLSSWWNDAYLCPLVGAFNGIVCDNVAEYLSNQWLLTTYLVNFFFWNFLATFWTAPICAGSININNLDRIFLGSSNSDFNGVSGCFEYLTQLWIARPISSLFSNCTCWHQGIWHHDIMASLYQGIWQFPSPALRPLQIQHIW